MILVIGPDSDLRFDVAMRAYDYTPSARADGPTWDDEQPGRPGGGADHFLDFIVAQAVPALAARAPLDPRRRTLCGTLVRWFVRAARVVAPTAVLLALRGDGPLVVVAGRLHPARGRTPRPLPAGRETMLLFMQGTSTEGESPAAPSPAGVSAAHAERLRHQRAAVPPQAGRDLAGRLDRAGVRAQYLVFPGMPHGPMLAASLPPHWHWLRARRRLEPKAGEKSFRPPQVARILAGPMAACPTRAAGIRMHQPLRMRSSVSLITLRVQWSKRQLNRKLQRRFDTSLPVERPMRLSSSPS
ncbi:hypothetical protein BKP43_07080 [Variovorax boronicumulans]|nr:hypothetical protein [Variovorax boronicumulans]PBI94909.1 hypothetical protein BKP43_07080 [Variovorax boronicumulans]